MMQMLEYRGAVYRPRQEQTMPMYTVQRITNSGKFYGTIHGSDDANITLCGKDIDHHWYILSNSKIQIVSQAGAITCPACLRVLK